jgi:hypothetical protein
VFPNLNWNVRVPEISMQKKTLSFLAVVFLEQVIFPGATCLAQAQAEKAPYPAMALLGQHLVLDENPEISLARNPPASISDAAEVKVLGRDGSATGVKGRNWLSPHRGTIMGRR